MPAEQLRSFSYLPLSIRVQTMGGIATPLVPRGTPLPTVRSLKFSTASDDQTVVEIAVFLGESSLAEHDLRLGKFMLENIPPAKQGSPQVRVEFSVDRTCTVHARAILEGSKLISEQAFAPPQNFDDTLISRCIAAAALTRTKDEEMVRKIEAENRAKSLIAQAEEQLKQGHNPSLSEAIAELGLALASGPSGRVREMSDSLEAKLNSSAPTDLDDIFASLFGKQTPQKGSSASTKKNATTGSPKSSRVSQQVASTGPTQHLGKIFGGGNFTLDTQLCFVLMPFSDRFQPLYDDHIRPSIERARLRCERADEIKGTGLITWDIWEKINRARFLIADLTNRNPNVFYEVGLAHAISKDVVLLTQSMDFVPFDLKALRCIVYEYTPRGVQSLEHRLSETIATLMKAG